MHVKVYIVQRATGEVLAVKLRHIDAHHIAKVNAPCRVLSMVADKTPDPNPPGSRGGSNGRYRDHPIRQD